LGKQTLNETRALAQRYANLWGRAVDRYQMPFLKRTDPFANLDRPTINDTTAPWNAEPKKPVAAKKPYTN
jgi:hypothetical protein